MWRERAWCERGGQWGGQWGGPACRRVRPLDCRHRPRVVGADFDAGKAVEAHVGALHPRGGPLLDCDARPAVPPDRAAADQPARLAPAPSGTGG